MIPKRIAIKFFVDEGPRAPLDLHPFIGLFHRFIQQGRLPGLLIDVADYAHVPEGPGVLLVGHDVDYGIDLRGGRAGLLTTRKRAAGLPLGELVRDTLRWALSAIEAIEEEAGMGLRFATGAATLEILDRLAVPNADEAFEAVAKEVEPVLREVFGDAGLELERAQGDDARKGLALVWRSSEAPVATALLARLGGPAVARAPAASQGPAAQSPWDVSVEQLARLRSDGADFVLIDVREPDEYETCNLEGRLIPLGTLAHRLDELDKSAHVVVHCEHGLRGAKAVALLREAGFANAWNLNGGIVAWIDRIDPSLTRN